ncbi:putative cobalt transporter subunit CbtA [Paraburkholderia caballeronis]|uniref:CbtA family protein n=1 Tax=Paraburkholderia caballeronis TaxID=416943 RepID=UPI001067177C|nr:CbtA family protein [Paraburkholderia caballeronis]TDV25579.1 putative cobalt transporter subunit CbtA [Paraburkholderia caballeronis]
MVGKLLIRGMLAGIAAGLLTFGFAKLAGEPQVDRAIAFEEKLDAAKGEAPEPELVSRPTQAGIGLATGVLVYGAAIGGLFSLVFAYVHGRASRLGARSLAAWLALAAFVSIAIVPALKYPPNPPSVGDPDTIGYRTGLFFLMVAVSIAATVFSLKLRRHAVARFGAWNGSIVAGLVFIAIIVAVQLALPVIDEVPAAFPATLLWKFRTVAIGMQAIMWTTIGLLFGALAERVRLPGARPAAAARHA